MLKKSKVIAVLSVCVMMFAVVQPAFAERSWEDVGEGAAKGGALGAIVGGALAGLVVLATGGAAAPLIPFVVGGAAVGAGAAAVNEDIGRNAQNTSWKEIGEKAVEVGGAYGDAKDISTE